MYDAYNNFENNSSTEILEFYLLSPKSVTWNLAFVKVYIGIEPLSGKEFLCDTWDSWLWNRGCLQATPTALPEMSLTNVINPCKGHNLMKEGIEVNNEGPAGTT